MRQKFRDFNGSNGGISVVLDARAGEYLDNDKIGFPKGAETKLVLEVGIMGEENSFKSIGGEGIFLAMSASRLFAVQIRPPGPFDVAHETWQKVIRYSVIKDLQPAFGAAEIKVLSIAPLYPFGTSTVAQAVAGVVVVVEAPANETFPKILPRVLPNFPNGNLSHPSWGRKALTEPTTARYLLPGKSEGASFYMSGADMPGRPNWQRAFRRDFARLVSRAVAANIMLKNAKPRNSPRLESASNKRRREAAQRSGSGAGSGPGAAAMADLSAGAPGPSDAAAAANESAEVDEEALLEGVFGGADGDDEMVTL